MARILFGLLLACLCGVAAPAPPSHEVDCPGAQGQAALPPMRPSPEGIWSTSVGHGFPILFIHGWTMDHRVEAWDYEPVLQQHLGWRRVYVDLPGMGRSADTTIRDQDEMLQRLLAFADRELGVGRFAIAGTSAGAYLAQALADRRSEQVAGLLLRMPMTVPDDSQRDRDTPAVRADEAIVQAPCYVKELRYRNDTRIEVAQAMANHSVLDPIRKTTSRYALSDPFQAASKPLPVPVLFITGRQDTAVGYRDAWRQLDRYPHASYVALDRAAHGYPVDHHDRALFDALIADWLVRVEEAETKEKQVVQESPRSGPGNP